VNTTAINRRALQSAAMLVPVLVLTYWLAGATPTAPSGNLARRAIPRELEGQSRWISDGEYELSDRAVQILRTNDYLLRSYVGKAGAGRVELCIVFAKDNRTAIHPPEVCLQGGGSRITGKQHHTITLDGSPGSAIDLMELAVESGGELRLYWYTYKVGDHFTVSFAKQQWLIWWNGLLRRAAGGALIRLSAAVDRGDVSDARLRLRHFSQAVFPHVVARLRVRQSASD